MKQTAVDFAVQQLEKLIPSGNQIIIGIILDKAKQMEKEQIKEAYQIVDLDIQHKDVGEINSEQYYKETYE